MTINLLNIQSINKLKSCGNCFIMVTIDLELKLSITLIPVTTVKVMFE